MNHRGMTHWAVILPEQSLAMLSHGFLKIKYHFDLILSLTIWHGPVINRGVLSAQDNIGINHVKVKLKFTDLTPNLYAMDDS